MLQCVQESYLLYTYIHTYICSQPIKVFNPNRTRQYPIGTPLIKVYIHTYIHTYTYTYIHKHTDSRIWRHFPRQKLRKRVRVFDILHDLRNVADSGGDQGLHPLLREGVGAATAEAAAAEGQAHGQSLQAHEYRAQRHGVA